MRDHIWNFDCVALRGFLAAETIRLGMYNRLRDKVGVLAGGVNSPRLGVDCQRRGL
ncbi:hypothetical protein [Bradyrhizobium sp. STM 3566]|uniref:hypothetical protein n=1 Tax=Bradyrhizobium sp. STM 3566 TaxID=578928 RepID=UPI00388D61FD